jgi:charged multivesicular body protein 4A/B
MSFFKNLFGGKKAEAGPTTSESIQKLRDTENMLLKKQEFLEQKLEAELKIAKENASSNKRGMTGHNPKNSKLILDTP